MPILRRQSRIEWGYTKKEIVVLAESDELLL
jgi:hypothetical protein